MNLVALKSAHLQIRQTHFLLLLSIVFFATLDGLRDTFFPGNPISYLKELIPILGLFLFLIYRNATQWKVRLSHWAIITSYLGFFSIAILNTHFYSGEFTHLLDALNAGGWSVIVKLGSLAGLTVYLFQLQRHYPDLFRGIPKLYTSGVIFYCLLTLLFVVSGLNRDLPQRNWHGRISIGYPTMDVAVLAAGLIFSLHSKRRKIIILTQVLFVLVLALQNTVSGYLLLAFYFGSMFIWLPGRWKVLPLGLFGVSIYSIWYIYNYLARQLGVFGLLIIDKINGFVFGNDTSSISMRKSQIAWFFNDIFSDPINVLFGGGGAAGFYVESHVFSLLGLSGIAGIIFYTISVSYMCLKFVRKRDQRNLFLIFGVYLLGGVSLTTITLFPFIFLLAYLAVSSAATSTKNFKL